jgi:hypothetical protein
LEARQLHGALSPFAELGRILESELGSADASFGLRDTAHYRPAGAADADLCRRSSRNESGYRQEDHERAEDNDADGEEVRLHFLPTFPSDRAGTD